MTEHIQQLKIYFKWFSDSIQFVSALVSLFGYLIITPWLSRTQSSPNANVITYDQTILAEIGLFNSVILFVIVICLLCILWNIVLAHAGIKLRFTMWRKTYRICISVVFASIMLWGFNLAYVVFFGGAFFFYNEQLYFWKKHAPWCHWYILLILGLSAGTLFRVKLELEEIALIRHENKSDSKLLACVWNQRW